MSLSIDSYLCIYRYIERERDLFFIFRNWLMKLWEVACPKSIGQAGRLTTWLRVDVAALSLNSVGQQAGNSGGFLCFSLENSSLIGDG